MRQIQNEKQSIKKESGVVMLQKGHIRQRLWKYS